MTPSPLLILCLLFAFLANAARSQAQAEQRPNIVFIFADDWGWGDLSCHGHPYVKTPNIDRLAAEGTDFTRFTVASGVCSPSRAAVMTGHFPARYAIDGHFAWVPSNASRGMPDWLAVDAPTMPRFLQQAGYATAHFGKWHLSNNMIPDSPTPGEYGYDEYGAFNCSGEQMPVHEDAQHANAFIEKSVEAGKPFFVNLWIHEPHTPFHTVPKYEWRFRHLENEADRIYASVLSHADDRIGEVLDTLDRLGVTDNTLVIFSSDNGPARGGENTKLELGYDTATGAGWMIGGSKGITAGRRGYKASLFDGGINVPFIARWPGVIGAGETNRSAISAVDLLPTFSELAGAKLPSNYQPDGLSQVEVLKGKTVLERTKPLFWKYPSAWPASKGKPDHWVSYAVAFGKWKLVANRDSSYFELYDIVNDPYESKDLKESFSEVAAGLLAKLGDWQDSLPEGPSGEVFSGLREKN
ncbi:sulfatase-like hydrolase/transferase [Pelagicoccus sp. SDUM812005]|uniref:sulfatase family protein n=1 Tax=Pelagicoccus sp. SDUM812005 TaxID=3041257 RepID=UPI00280E404D|nr:sulfatase-like hydrolase/transferase [Pelagicoccus sp. SDUM812005]MDQ8180243.1 sulfatase-like hydrolase/transferase [Pelagicoccus sp. SDUM812005]